jgi:hypothetical protein
MKITRTEYDVIMQAISNAKDSILEDTFIDPYDENVEGYTNRSLMDALESIENKLINEYNPF